MPLRNKKYGKPKDCEYCGNPRGAPLRSIMSYGCVLCVACENYYQKGQIELPDSATKERRDKATDKILG